MQEQYKILSLAEALELTRAAVAAILEGQDFIGTAFALSVPTLEDGEMTGGKTTLVTCRHVVTAANEPDRLIYRTPGGDWNVSGVRKKMGTSSWYQHGDITVDLAIMRHLRKREATWALVPPRTALHEEVEIGRRVFVVGFPAGIGAEDFRGPVVKAGIVARKDEDKFLVDVQIQGGNSGSPVFVEAPIHNKEAIIQETDGKKAYNVKLGFAGIATSVYREDPHLAVIVPVDRILECIYSKGSRYLSELVSKDKPTVVAAAKKLWSEFLR